MTNAGQMKIVLHSSCVTKLEIIAVFCHGSFFLTFWMSGMTCYLASIITDEKYNDKLTSVCYNQLKALYFCKYDTTAYLLQVCITLKRADHFAFFDKDMEIFNALCYRLIAGKLKCQM